MNFFKKTNPIRNILLVGVFKPLMAKKFYLQLFTPFREFFSNRVKYFLAFLVLSVLNFKLANIGLAQDFGPSQLQMEAFNKKSGFEEAEGSTVGSIMSTVIQAFLGLLGIIFLVLMITAGFKWMMASGNEDKIKEAKDTILRAIIGLIIVVGAYAITYFVFNAMDWGGGGEGYVETSGG